MCSCLESNKINILAIDDDKDILKMLSKFLYMKGYMVDTAETGAEAIEKAKAKAFNLALIDIVLPDMKGTQLLTNLKDTVPKMRKIIITGNATLDNAIEAVNLGAHTYLMKPLNPKEILKAIEEQLKNQQEEKVITQKKIAEYIKANKADFLKIMKKSCTQLMGESSTLAIIHHLGGPEAIKDPNIFAEKLKTILGEGAEIVLKKILEYLETSSEKT